MAELFLPVLSHFQNENPWSASVGRLRYRILPTVNGEDLSGTVTVEVWEGPWAYEFSTVEESRSFPLTEEGLGELPAYILEWAERVNGRPKRSMVEDDGRRVAPEG